METVTLETIHKDLEFVKKEIRDIKENMVDIDSILSKDEEVLLKKARKEYEEGKTISLEELEKELNK